MHHRFSFGGDFGACFTASLGLLVQSLRHRRGPPNIAQLKYFDLKISSFGPDLQHVTDLNVATGLNGLACALNPSKFACAARHAARLEKPRCPQPFVQTHTGHEHMVNALPRR